MIVFSRFKSLLGRLGLLKSSDHKIESTTNRKHLGCLIRRM